MEWVSLHPNADALELTEVGTVESVIRRHLTESENRPKVYIGIVNHGLYATPQNNFSVVHAGIADMTFSLAPTYAHAKPTLYLREDWAEDFLPQLLLDTPTLKASSVAPHKLLEIQLRKLTVNAVINPLTVIFNCRNGELFNQPEINPLIVALVKEISSVNLGILGADRGLHAEGSDLKEPFPDFETTKLLRVVYDIGRKTARNISSMRQDALAGRETEIYYINGYISRRAKGFRIATPINDEIVRLVESKTALKPEDVPQLLSKCNSHE